MFNFISIGSNWDLSLSSGLHTTTRKTTVVKIKKNSVKLRENGSEVTKSIKKMFNWVKVKSQRDLPLLLQKPLYLPIKRWNQKIFWIQYSTLDGLCNDTTHNSLPWLYRSAKIDWTKNPFEYIVPPPAIVCRNNNVKYFKMAQRFHIFSGTIGWHCYVIPFIVAFAPQFQCETYCLALAFVKSFLM